MPIVVQCECGKKYKVGDDEAGLTMRCKDCRAAIPIPAGDDEIGDDEWGDLGDDYGEPVAAPRPKSKSGS